MIRQIILIVTILISTLSVSAQKAKLVFDMKYGFVKGGRAIIEISETKYKNIPAIRYSIVGRTTGLTDKLFGINDVYETVVDAQTDLPLKSIRNIKEKKYRWYNETLYFQDFDSIYSQRSGGRKVSHNLVDIVSVFFYFVNNHLDDNIQNGFDITLPTFHADKISNVTIRYLGEETIKTALGNVETLVLAPLVDKGKLLNRSDGLRIYISKKERMPVLLEFDTRFGSLKALLRSYQVDGVEQINR
ncbi:MAG: hypothetical protein CSA36_00830 [Draconibacterium sp.]|nr:MAG: hypothetical protein CSA36_00830 [Draconibacterium sp.]